MDEDGRINGKLPVFNDLLAFVWNKMEVAPRDTLLNVVKSFYKQEEVFKARDVLFSSIPETGKRVKNRKVDDVLQGVYSIMLALSTEDSPIFIALNLNNLPCIDMKNVDGASLVCQQAKLNETVSNMRTEQEVMKSEIRALNELIKNRFLETEQSRRTDAERTGNHSRDTSATVRDTAEDSTLESFDSRNIRIPMSAPLSNASGSAAVSPAQDRTVTRRRSQATFATVAAGSSRDSRGERQPLQVASSSNETTESSDWVLVNHRKKSKPVITGTKRGTGLRAVSQIKLTRVFVSRLLPDISVEVIREYVSGLVSDDFEIVKLKTRYPSYSSFVITCDLKHRDTLLNPEEWEEGVLLRPFLGKLNPTNADTA